MIPFIFFVLFICIYGLGYHVGYRNAIIEELERELEFKKRRVDDIIKAREEGRDGK